MGDYLNISIEMNSVQPGNQFYSSEDQWVGDSFEFWVGGDDPSGHFTEIPEPGFVSCFDGRTWHDRLYTLTQSWHSPITPTPQQIGEQWVFGKFYVYADGKLVTPPEGSLEDCWCSGEQYLDAWLYQHDGNPPRETQHLYKVTVTLGPAVTGDISAVTLDQPVYSRTEDGDYVHMEIVGDARPAPAGIDARTGVEGGPFQWIGTPTFDGRTVTARVWAPPQSLSYLAGDVYILGRFTLDIDGDTVGTHWDTVPTGHLHETFWIDPAPGVTNEPFIGLCTAWGGCYYVFITAGPAMRDGDVTGLVFERQYYAHSYPASDEVHLVLAAGTGDPEGHPHRNSPLPAPGSGTYAATVTAVAIITQSGYELVWVTITPPVAAVNVVSKYHLSPGGEDWLAIDVTSITGTGARKFPPVVANNCLNTDTGVYSVSVWPDFDEAPEGYSSDDRLADTTVATFSSSASYLPLIEVTATPDHGLAPLPVAFEIPSTPT